MRMNLTFAGHRCSDHSPSSGYDQVCALFPQAAWLSGPELAAGELTWVRQPASGGLCNDSSQIFHVFYGDCSGSALPAILRARFPQAAIVATVHQPVGRLLNDAAAFAALREVDGIIAVSQKQAKDLADCGVTVPVHVVPHGVWTDVFRPPAPLAPDGTVRRDGVLLVGSYLRDWPGARQIVRLLAAAGVRSLVLGSAAAKWLQVSDPLVKLVQRVPETELAGLYARSAALLLPVLDATASNALLEAMAAGCPVVCPWLPSLVEEYIGDDVDAYPAGAYETAAVRALTYAHDPDRRAARSQALIRRAGRFDWARLRPRLIEAYRSHHGQGSRSTGA
jgi:glycosyltransferase involved in cell wall biosynthesis